MASERPGCPSCFEAHLSTVSRNSFDSRIAVTGSRPVAGRPRPFFGTTLFDFAIKCSTIKASRGEVVASAPALTQPRKVNPMAKATRVLSTPPTNTPVDTTRRRFLTVAAIGSIFGAGNIAAAAMAPNDVPQAVTVPKDSGFQADPIYEVIERHRKAALAHTEAVHIKFAFEEHGMQGEKLAEYKRLDAVADAAWNEMDDVGRDLINTLPTTFAGILALCRYIEPIFAEDDQPDLPEYLTYDDDTAAYPAEAFAYVIGKSIEKLMKTEGMVS